MTTSIIDELIVKLGLDASDYKKGADTADKSFKKLRDNAGETAKDLDEKGKKAGAFWTAQKVELLGFLGVIAGGATALAGLTIKTDGFNAALGRTAQVTNTTAPLGQCRLIRSMRTEILWIRPRLWKRSPLGLKNTQSVKIFRWAACWVWTRRWSMP